MRSEFFLQNEESATAFGRELGAKLSPGAVVALYGELGAGKTTLIKGIAEAAAGIDPREVNSPTFTYLNIYSGKQEVYHFDLYRLSGAEDFISMGFEEYLTSSGVCCIEWPERIPSLLPARTLIVELTYASLTTRNIKMKGHEGTIY